MQTEQLLCWSGMTDTEPTTSGSNEVVVVAEIRLNSFSAKLTFGQLY